MRHKNVSPHALPGESEGDTISRLLRQARDLPVTVQILDDPNPNVLTEDEREVLRITAETWNAFLRLPQQHPDDKTEFRHTLHALQRIILARPGVREALQLCPAP